jgi:hypothetical protein
VAVLVPIHPIASLLAILVLSLFLFLAVLVPNRPKPNLDVVVFLVLYDRASGLDGAAWVFLFAGFLAPMPENLAKRTAQRRKLFPTAPK